LWLAFIGWFLNNASVQSYRQVAIKDMLSGVQVSEVMRTNPPTLEPHCTVNDLMHVHLMNSDDQAFPIIEQDQLVGIVTLDDVRRAPRDQWDDIHVSGIMTPRANLIITSPDEEVITAMDKLIQRDVRQLPVLNQHSELLGLLRRRDIMRWLNTQSEFSG
jgi:predicted transcriptional regulator